MPANNTFATHEDDAVGCAEALLVNKQTDLSVRGCGEYADASGPAGCHVGVGETNSLSEC